MSKDLLPHLNLLLQTFPVRVIETQQLLSHVTLRNSDIRTFCQAQACVSQSHHNVKLWLV